MQERFIDSIKVQVTAGKGGDGSVHFDSRKYEAFGGPDGGDGGRGGSVVLVGDKNVDNLQQLEYRKLHAPDGADGAGGLKRGRDADDLEIRVPLGTLAYESRIGAEIGCVNATGEMLVVAQGGKGGKGNPKYATGSRRTPRIAQSGEQGVQRGIELRWRIFADSFLIEPHETVIEDELLLPKLLERDPAEVDYELYLRKPRWLRIRGLYENYDAAYLPVVLFEDGELEQAQLEHVYWARHLFINLQPFADTALGAWQGLASELGKHPFRRLEQLVVVAEQDLPLGELKLECEFSEKPDVRMVVVDGSEQALEQFMGQLTGGVVD